MKFKEMFFPVSDDKENKNKEKRERVSNLTKKDNHYEDSIRDLAEAENSHRKLLKERGITNSELLNELGDIHSTEVLGRIEAEKEKWVDKLTELRNKNAFNEEIVSFLNLEHRLGQNCGLLMLDFDFFKKVNDQYGHPAGDEALKQISKIISSAIRSSDIAYRYGGEEFAVFLPDVNTAGALLIAERLRASVEEAIITIHDSEKREVQLKKTISLGLSNTENINDWNVLLNLSSDEIKEKIMKQMVAEADKALYKAKQNGRNRVETCEKEDVRNAA
jgi:diguanylate cyclase (GGDEF)-like protein